VKHELIEQGCCYKGASGQIREVIWIHGLRLRYRQVHKGSATGYGTPEVGFERAMSLIGFANWADAEVTEQCANPSGWLREGGEGAA